MFPPPQLYTLETDPTEIEIEGEPSSTSTTVVRISDTQNFSDDVDLTATNIPQRDGNNLFNVSFADNTLSTEGDETGIVITTAQPIYTNKTYQITIQGDSDGEADEEDSATIRINADGFSPRTIEEF